MKSTVLAHKIYCDVSYKRLVDLLAGFLSAHGYKSSDLGDYELVKFKHFEFRSNKNKVPSHYARVMVSMSRSVSASFGEFSFRVGHLRHDCVQKNTSFCHLPLGVRQRFEAVPNYIEILFYHRGYNRAQKLLSEQLRGWLKAKKINSYVSSFEGEYLDVLNSYYQEPDKVVLELKKLVEAYSHTNDMPALDIDLYPKDFVHIMSKLSKNSIITIKTGEMIESFIPDLPDYSGVIIEYCKAVEIELEEKLLAPLKSHWQSVDAPSVSVSAEAKVKRLNAYIFSSTDNKLELGTFADQLKNALTCTTDLVAQSLLSSINALPLTIDAQQLVTEIFHISRSFRNPAAHKSILTKSDLNNAKDAIFGNESRMGILAKLIETS
ncbi:hypothetical protein [Psychromonas sp. Urea-02u-13]|uniref:hypothetical protein n=1 Tax=Psychromonas sp. Urea-02u-13 TaxID=2058326 RepID=UPI000C3403F3|nr:hypothetical protein [Psychromonas sp. Urea-02u-13]PKG37724.1 hypothetical protein CXF74_17470 [Psychromonas sp. Urea-02u-13]